MQTLAKFSKDFQIPKEETKFDFAPFDLEDLDKEAKEEEKEGQEDAGAGPK